MSFQPRRRLWESRAALLAAFTAMSAVAFGLIVYFTGTSVAWFATSPTADPLFGDLNECLLRRVPDGRVGFAVAPDGAAVASFSGNGVAICRASANGRPEQQWISLPGISGAAWDFSGTLWLSTSGASVHPAGLWRVQQHGAPVLAGEASIVALGGHRDGVVALDASGKLMSLGQDGRALGYAELPAPALDDVQLSVDAAGETLSVVARGAVWFFSADRLSGLRAESPCQVQYLWWLAEPARALVSCGPNESWALTLDPHTGAKDAAPRRPRERSVLIPKKAVWVRECDALPCEARQP